MDLPFCIEYLDAERLLPVLVRKAARKGRQEGQRSTLEGVDVGAPGRKTPANPSSLRANARRNSHCAPTTSRKQLIFNYKIAFESFRSKVPSTRP
jgi:hypothetical protein